MPDPLIYLEFLRQHFSRLPGALEALSHGTPAFYVNKKLLARLWEDGQILVVRTQERERWIRSDPETFFLTDHYCNYPCMLVRLDRVVPRDLESILTNAWLERASKAQAAGYGKH